MVTMIDNDSDALFSIFIPTWNNIEYLKLCVRSIRENSFYKHEILVHVNEGTDGTLQWVKSQNIKHTYSSENIGVCFSVNRLRSLASTDYIVYMNDDMYVCPNWDKALWDEIQSLKDNRFFISSTLIEPYNTNNPCVIFDNRFGDNLETFDEKRLKTEYKNLEHNDWNGATWPPNIVHKDIWDLIGGYSIEFTPGMYSDPDFAAKLYYAGVRYFKGVASSKVFHFGTKTTGRIKKNDGKTMFLRKWNTTSSTFMNDVLKRGEIFSKNSAQNEKKMKTKLKSRFELFLSFFK